MTSSDMGAFLARVESFFNALEEEGPVDFSYFLPGDIQKILHCVTFAVEHTEAHNVFVKRFQAATGR